MKEERYEKYDTEVRKMKKIDKKQQQQKMIITKKSKSHVRMKKNINT